MQRQFQHIGDWRLFAKQKAYRVIFKYGEMLESQIGTGILEN